MFIPFLCTHQAKIGHATLYPDSLRIPVVAAFGIGSGYLSREFEGNNK